MTAAPDPRAVSALLLGAGEGTRMGNRAKAFLEAEGVSLLQRAAQLARRHCDEILAGVRAEDLDKAAGAIAGLGAIAIAGGPTRQETVGILLDRAEGEFVVVHDVARPFATDKLLESVLAAATHHGAAAPFLPVSTRDGLGRAEGHELVAPLRREEIVRTQTPQAYRRDWLEEAYRMAEAQGWQEQSTTGLVLRAGRRIGLVPGDPENLKITYPEDWDAAKDRLGPV